MLVRGLPADKRAEIDDALAGPPDPEAWGTDPHAEEAQTGALAMLGAAPGGDQP